MGSEMCIRDSTSTMSPLTDRCLSTALAERNGAPQSSTPGNIRSVPNSYLPKARTAIWAAAASTWFTWFGDGSLVTMMVRIAAESPGVRVPSRSDLGVLRRAICTVSTLAHRTDEILGNNMFTTIMLSKSSSLWTKDEQETPAHKLSSLARSTMARSIRPRLTHKQRHRLKCRLRRHGNIHVNKPGRAFSRDGSIVAPPLRKSNKRTLTPMTVVARVPVLPYVKGALW